MPVRVREAPRKHRVSKHAGRGSNDEDTSRGEKSSQNPAANTMTEAGCPDEVLAAPAAAPFASTLALGCQCLTGGLEHRLLRSHDVVQAEGVLPWRGPGWP